VYNYMDKKKNKQNIFFFLPLVVNAFSSLLEDVNREILSSIIEKENVPTIIENEVPLG